MIAKWAVVLMLVGLALSGYPVIHNVPEYQSRERYALQYQSSERFAPEYQSRERYSSEYQSRERFVPEYRSRERYVPEYRSEERYAPEYRSKEGMPYRFQYSVKDNYTGNDFGQTEHSNGDDVKGSYTVQLSDGRKQTVNYTADDETGYQAVVSYDGEAQYSHDYGTPVTFKPKYQESHESYQFKPYYKPKSYYKPRPNYKPKPSYSPQPSYNVQSSY